ncbi:MAG: hypothetical protein RIS86_965 [Planctomycetota bacterium]
MKGPTVRDPIRTASLLPALALALAAALAACDTAPSTSDARGWTAADVPGVTDAAPGTVAYDRDVFQTLLGNHDRIHREVRLVEGGVETVTESDDASVAILIKDHVRAMKSRIEERRRIRQWDPMFRAVFDHAAEIEMTFEETPAGVRVRETSADPAVARLIQAHARVVDGFVARGGAASREAHPVPAGAAGAVD